MLSKAQSTYLFLALAVTTFVPTIARAELPYTRTPTPRPTITATATMTPTRMPTATRTPEPVPSIHCEVAGKDMEDLEGNSRFIVSLAPKTSVNKVKLRIGGKIYTTNQIKAGEKYARMVQTKHFADGEYLMTITAYRPRFFGLISIPFSSMSEKIVIHNIRTPQPEVLFDDKLDEECKLGDDGKWVLSSEMKIGSFAEEQGRCALKGGALGGQARYSGLLNTTYDKVLARFKMEGMATIIIGAFGERVPVTDQRHDHDVVFTALKFVPQSEQSGGYEGKLQLVRQVLEDNVSRQTAVLKEVPAFVYKNSWTDGILEVTNGKIQGRLLDLNHVLNTRSAEVPDPKPEVKKGFVALSVIGGYAKFGPQIAIIRKNGN